METIKHYGVKGMRWGKRKSTSETGDKPRMSEGKKTALKILAVSGGVVVAGAITYAAVKTGKKHLSSIDLDAKTVFQNVNTYGDKLHTDKPLYVTFDKKDRKTYATKFVDEVMGRLDAGQAPYATLFEGKDRIKAPSRHETRKLYTSWRDSVNRPVSGKDVDKGLRNFFRTSALSGTYTANSPDSFETFLKAKGYNAVQDMLDSSNGYKAKTPLMVFNGNDQLRLIGSKLVSDMLKDL